MSYNRIITLVEGNTTTINLSQIFDGYQINKSALMVNLRVEGDQTSTTWNVNFPYWFQATREPASNFPYPMSQWGSQDMDISWTITPQNTKTIYGNLTIWEAVDYPTTNSFPYLKQVSNVSIEFRVSPAVQYANPTRANIYDRVIRIENNKTTQVSFGTDGLFPNGEQLQITSSLPAWITNNTINSFTQFWSLAPTSINTYNYYADVYLREGQFNQYKGIALITVIVVESLFEEIDNCCSDENVNIVWLNRQGGRGNFIFTQRKDFNVEVGKKSTYITNDIKRYSEIKNVHNGFKVYATGISKNQIDFLDTLRYSIQCWLYINDSFIPLILDVGSFEKYNTKENMYEIAMNFLYAERLNIQRQ